MRWRATAALARASMPILTRLEPELSHRLALAGLAMFSPWWRAPRLAPMLGLRCFGLEFAHPLGLAAGFDKNGDYLDALGSLGFSHIELGTVTPRPQPGNPKPRLFRLRSVQAIVNRMGFNNKGVDHLVAQLARSRYAGIRGVSIGKNFDTPIENASDDYLACMRKVYQHADYIAVNVSSPNTARLRELQGRDGLDRIVGTLQEAREELCRSTGKRVPLLVKIAPDLDTGQISTIAGNLRALQVDGVIATNTSTDLHAYAAQLPPNQLGGISGEPLHAQSISVIARLRDALGEGFPIIGVGGITSANTALATLQAGANLLQIYTGFAYRGAALVEEILAGLALKQGQGGSTA